MNIIKKIRKKVFYFLQSILRNNTVLAKTTALDKTVTLDKTTALENLTKALEGQINKSHFTQALISAKAMVKIEPNNPNFQLNLIQLLKKNLFYQEAFLLIKKNQQKHPAKYYFFYMEEADLLQKAGYQKKALFIYKKLAKFYPLKIDLLKKIQILENNFSNIFVAPATGQLKKIQNTKIQKIQRKINISKLQKVLFQQKETL